MSRILDRLRHRHQPWFDNDLSAWHPQHRDPSGGVWAIKPPCGYDNWQLCEPASEYRAVGEAEERDGVWLDQTRSWMQRWVERVSGGQVTAMVEGWSHEYGPSSQRGHEYIVYARVVAR